MFTAKKREWSELYTFFTLLKDGKVTLGNSLGKPSKRFFPIHCIKREEHDGSRSYFIEDEDVRIVPEEGDEYRIPREDFGTVAMMVLEAMKGHSEEDDIESPEGVEEFLDAVKIFNLEAQTEDRTDLFIVFYTQGVPPMGFRIYSRVGTMDPLMDGGRTANIKYHLDGIKIPTPAVNKINATEASENPVARRMMMVEAMGGVLKFDDAADKVFRSNLNLIDLHFPRLLGEMTRMMYLDGTSRVRDLVDKMKELNPLKIKDELIEKHGYYEYKVKQFLMAVALGMRPTKVFDGFTGVVSGFIFVDASGKPLCYSVNDRAVFENFLLNNTRLVHGNVERDHYGYLERENGQWYFRLNAKVALTKK